MHHTYHSCMHVVYWNIAISKTHLAILLLCILPKSKLNLYLEERHWRFFSTSFVMNVQIHKEFQSSKIIDYRMSIPQPLQPSHAVTLKVVPFADLPKLPFPPAQWLLPPPNVVSRPVNIPTPASAIVVATPALEPQLAWIPYTILSILKAVKNMQQLQLQHLLLKYPTRDPFNM